MNRGNRTASHSAAIAIVSIIACCPVAAQDGEGDPQGMRAAREAVRFEVAQDGHVEVFPDPDSGGFGPTGNPFADVAVVYDAVSSAPWWQFVFAGGSDLTSAADAIRYFERIGELDPERLLARVHQRVVPKDSEPKVLALQRRLAVYALADLGFKPALGRLEALVEDESVEEPLRRAAAEAIAVLRGRVSSEERGDALAPLADVLAAAPANHDVLIVVDRFRMPPGRNLLAAVRAAELKKIESQIRAAGGRVQAADWAGASVITERLGLVAYELARRFGDQRIDRVVLALRLEGEIHRATDAWLSLEGKFDLTAIRAELPRAADASADESTLRFTLEDGVALTIGAKRVVVTRPRPTVDPLGSDAARSLAAALPSTPLRGVIRRLPWKDVGPFPALIFGLSLKSDGDSAAELVLHMTPEASARELALNAIATALREWFAEKAKGGLLAALGDGLRITEWEGGLRILVPRGAIEPAVLLLELSRRR